MPETSAMSRATIKNPSIVSREKDVTRGEEAYQKSGTRF